MKRLTILILIGLCITIFVYMKDTKLTLSGTLHQYDDTYDYDILCKREFGDDQGVVFADMKKNYYGIARLSKEQYLFHEIESIAEFYPNKRYIPFEVTGESDVHQSNYLIGFRTYEDAIKYVIYGPKRSLNTYLPLDKPPVLEELETMYPDHAVMLVSEGFALLESSVSLEEGFFYAFDVEGRIVASKEPKFTSMYKGNYEKDIYCY